MLAGETSESVLADIATAFVDLTHSAVVELLIPLTFHASARVRRGAVHGLLQATEQVVSRFVELAGDPDDEVRNWALFALGSLAEKGKQVDAVREAFAAHLEDPHDEARAEAILGLAHCRDARAINPTHAGLNNETRFVHYLEEAAALISAGLGSDELRHALRRI